METFNFNLTNQQVTHFNFKPDIGIVDRQRCKKCDKDFPTQKALICHVGVRHILLNKVLRTKGYRR